MQRALVLAHPDRRASNLRPGTSANSWRLAGSEIRGPAAEVLAANLNC